MQKILKPFPNLLLLLILIAISLILFSCSDGSQTVPQEGSEQKATQNEQAFEIPENKPDPYNLITSDDLRDILDIKVFVKESIRFSELIAANVVDEDDFPIASIQIDARDYTIESFVSTVKENARKMDVDAEEISGVGDVAYWFMEMLIFLKGPHYFQIVLTNYETPSEQRKQQAIKIAEVVLSRL